MSDKPTTITFLAYMNGAIDIASLFEAIPIVKVVDESGQEVFFSCEGRKNNGEKTKPRITLPFYGQDKDEAFIISVRYKGFYRGVRRGGKCLNNVTAVDFQCCGKNLHVKISKTKFTFTGVLNEAMGEEAASSLANLLNIFQRNIIYLQNHSEEVYESLELLNKGFPACDNHIGSILAIYQSEFEDFSSFRNKIESLLKLPNFLSCELLPLSFQVCTKAYMHSHLKQDILLHKLAIFLSIKGLQVDFDNQNPTELIVVYPSEGIKEKIHLLSIHRDSKIRHNSPASDEENKKIFHKIQGYLKEFNREHKCFHDYIQDFKKIKSTNINED